MGKLALRAIVPVWAQRIEVEKREESLWITGHGHVSNPVVTSKENSQRVYNLDILQRFKLYQRSQAPKKHRQLDGAGIYEFANANDDQKLAAFCLKFGPFSGTVHSRQCGEDHSSTLMVIQSLELLRKEQRRFAAAVKLLQQLDRTSHADRMTMLTAMHDLEVVDQETLGLIYFSNEVLPLVQTKTKRTASFLAFGHLVLCGLLNEFSLKLFPVDGQVIDLPDVQSEGIRNAVYYQLRLDYLAQRTIRVCLHCGNHFSVYRHGTTGCGLRCQRAIRNRKYWDSNKASVNRERRGKEINKTILRGKTNGTHKAG